MDEKRLFDLEIGEGYELLSALQNAGITTGQDRRLIYDPVYAQECIDQLPEELIDRFRFTKYVKYLFPISRQAKDIRELNKQVPVEYQIPDSKFDALDTESNHIQRYRDLEFLFISLGDFHKTQKLIREQAKITHGKISLSDTFEKDEKEFQLHATAARFFYDEPGIYRLRINLAAGWEPENSHSVSQLWKKDLNSGKKLNAGSLGDAALNVQHQNLRYLQDGLSLPWHDHTDIIRPNTAEFGRSRAPSSHYYGSLHLHSALNIPWGTLYFESCDFDEYSKCYSAPALVE